ncbi:jg1974, partial [Pararge aegeria aegeria]
GTSKKDKLHRLLSQLYNKSMDNVDVFTVFSKLTVKDAFLDVRFSAHGSPYFEAEKLDSMVIGIQEKPIAKCTDQVSWEATGRFYKPLYKSLVRLKASEPD